MLKKNLKEWSMAIAYKVDILKEMANLDAKVKFGAHNCNDDDTRVSLLKDIGAIDRVEVI